MDIPGNPKGGMNMRFKIKATTPCYKFINASKEAQIAKIREEVAEAEEAWNTFSETKTRDNLRKLLEEMFDIKACVNTAILQIRESVEAENRLRRAEKEKFIAPLNYFGTKEMAKLQVINKNMRRGYYVEPAKDGGR